MIRIDRRPMLMTSEERTLRDRLRDQCNVWIDKHLMTLFVSLNTARAEHAGCDDLQAPEIRIMIRADLVRYEPAMSLVGEVVITTEEHNP